MIHSTASIYKWPPILTVENVFNRLYCSTFIIPAVKYVREGIDIFFDSSEYRRSMTGRLVDARSTLDDLLKQLADKQESLRYFCGKQIFNNYNLLRNLTHSTSTCFVISFQSIFKR